MLLAVKSSKPMLLAASRRVEDEDQQEPEMGAALGERADEPSAE